ncbi:MAG: histidinol-phosphatase, partial [Pseudomonadota bacterium]
MEIPPPLQAELTEVLGALIAAARPETLRHFRKDDLAADNKAGAGGFDPVTEADRRAEAEM